MSRLAETWAKNKYKLIKAKWNLSNAESLREFSNWYDDRWKHDYPDLYKMRYSTAFRQRLRGTRYAGSARRRRLMVTGRTKRRKRQYARVKLKNPKFWSELGEPVGHHTGKRCIAISDPVNVVDYPSNQLHFTDNLINIAQGDAINERQRRIVNLRGIEIHSIFNFRSSRDGVNVWPGAIEPIYLHIAVVHPKNNDAQFGLTTANFFRSYGASRQESFTTSQPAIRQIFNPINSDMYHVYFHKHYKIAEFLSGTSKAQNPEMLFKKYVKLNRQVRFNGSTGTSCEDSISLCWWFTSSQSNGTTPLIYDIAQWRYEIINHYREPTN